MSGYSISGNDSFLGLSVTVQIILMINYADKYEVPFNLIQHMDVIKIYFR